MDEVIARFHSLQGNNLQEIKRSFNELLNVIRRDVPRQADLDFLIESINPKTKLESILKVEILIHFKRYDALLDILKSRNPMLIAKVLKCWKFFEVVFSKIDAETLVHQIFPHTSFSVRMKIITKLSVNLKNEELADGYFHAIEDKYGLFVTKGLLPACSLDLIKSTVAFYNLILTSRQLMRIVKRDCEFLGYYFNVLYQAYGEDFDFSNKYSEALSYVAKVDDQLFWELFKTYKLKVKFGYRMTPKLYERGKELVETSNYKQRIFNFRNIYKIIRKSDDDLHKFILKLFPKKVENFNTEYASNCLKTLVGYVPKNKKYDMVNGCFEKAYGRGICKFLNLDFPEDILQLIPVQEREVYIVGKHAQDESLIYMYPTKKSIPLLQERIKYTSNIRKRSKLAVLLCKTCRFNEDSEALLEILKYMRLRHKNDRLILVDFLMSLCEWKDMKKFNGEHWVLIHELLKLIMPNHTIYDCVTYLKTKYFQYALKNNLQCDEFMRTILRYLKEEGGCFDSQFDDEKCETFYYDSFAQLLPQMYRGEDFLKLSCSLLAGMARFNERRPKNKIVLSGYSELMSIFQIQFGKLDFYDADAVISYCLKFEYNDFYDQIYWKNFRTLCHADTLIWYLQNKPGKVLEHIDDVLTPRSIYLLNYYMDKILMLMSLLESISEKVINFALDGLHHEDLLVVKFSVTALSYLMKEQEFFEITKSFLPPLDGKLDLNNMAVNHISAQECTVKSLLNFNDPVACLPLLLKFCVGDFMNYALGPLYRIANWIPELKLKDFLDALYQSKTSVRKHFTDLTIRLETKQEVYNYLKASGEGEKHVSLRKTILKSTLTYFSANPSQTFWDLLKCNIQIVDENDQEAFAYLVNLRKIPIKYQPQYIPMVYEILAKNNHKEIASKKSELLMSVPNNLINKIDVSFLKYAVRDSVFQSDAGQESDFYLKSVFYTTREKQMDILSVILDVLKTYVEKNWCNSACGKTRMYVYNVVRGFCLRAIKINADHMLVKKFLQFWTLMIKKGELLEEYLLLELTSAYLTCASEAKPREYGAKVSEILMEWIEWHGPSIIPVFAEELVNFLKESLILDDENQVDFINGLLHANMNDLNSALVLNILFGLMPLNNIEDKFESVLEEMRGFKSTVVQLPFRRLLRKLSESNVKG